jgi:hypothetical protein
MAEANAAARSARRWCAGILVLVATLASVRVISNPSSTLAILIALAIPAGVAILTARGLRWARGLLTVVVVLQALNIPDIVSGPLTSLSNLTLLVYGAGTLWCVAALYRQPAASYFPAQAVKAAGPHSAPMKRARRLVMLWTVGITFVVSVGLVMWVVDRLAAQRGVRPDFGTNGLNWIAAGAGLISGMVFPLYLALIFYIVIPRLRQSARWDQTRWLSSTWVMVGALMPELVLLLVSLGSSNFDDRIAGVVLIGPPLVGTAAACYWYLRRLDAEFNPASGAPV